MIKHKPTNFRPLAALIANVLVNHPFFRINHVLRSLSEPFLSTPLTTELPSTKILTSDLDQRRDLHHDDKR